MQRVDSRTRVYYVDTPKYLKNLINVLNHVDIVGFDLEADCFYHYEEKICLIQLYVKNSVNIVDPIAIDIKPLFDALKNKTLVIHGSQFDVRMMLKEYNFKPHKLYDTHAAACLLGYPKKSYAALVQHYIGIELDKTYQKANWTKRPLTKRMINYAANDTLYLLEIFSCLTEELNKASRFSWFEEQCVYIVTSVEKTLKTESKKKVWLIPGSGSFNKYELAILKDLYFWRDKKARSSNLNVHTVILNKQLIDIVSWVSDVSKEEMPTFLLRHRYKDEILLVLSAPHLQRMENPKSTKKDCKTKRILTEKGGHEINDPNSNNETKQPIPKAKKIKKTNNQKGLKELKDKLKTQLQELRIKEAASLNIDASLLFSVKTIDTIINSNINTVKDMRKSDHVMSWQVDVLGDKFIALIQEYQNAREEFQRMREDEEKSMEIEDVNEESDSSQESMDKISDSK